MILLSRTKLGKFVAIPYGPYICLGCLAWMFRGPQLVNWYLNLFRV
jgi:leader peptidase (prepilin peptidase)/N-methyltransferase